MSDFLTKLDRLFDRLALEPDVSVTALFGGGSTYLILSDEPDKYVAYDSWVVGLDAVLREPRKRGAFTARACRLAGAEVNLVFGDTSWATEPLTLEDRTIVDGLFAIHDPRGLIRKLQADNKPRIDFESSDEIAKYGDVFSDFFSIIGLSPALFISDLSTLSDWCRQSDVSLEHANARIHEVYGVDVSDLDGGRLIDVFERIRHGDYYRGWRAEHGT